MNILAEGHSKEFQQIDQVWAQAEQNPLVQDCVVDMVDPRLAKPENAPTGYSAVAVAVIAETSIRAMREIESTAILGASSVKYDVESAATDLRDAREAVRFSERLDAAGANYGQVADQSTLDARQAKIDLAEQEFLGTRMTVDALQPTLAKGEHILATQRVLAKGAFLLATLPPAALMGGVYGGLFWYGEHVSNVHPDRIGTHTTEDANAPGAYPVFPNAPEGSKIVQNPDGTYTVTTTITQDQQGERALNDYAPTCGLTGTELAADKAAAQRSLQLVKDANGNIISAKVLASASDEASGAGIGLGHPDTINDCLSDKRAEKGLEALSGTANELGVKLPATVEKVAQEAILKPEQIKQVDRLADSLRLSRSGLINNYNGDRSKLNPQAVAEMDKLFGNNRGITIELTVERKTEVVQPHTEPQEEKNWTDEVKEYKIGGISLTWFIAGGAAFVGGLLGMPQAGRVADRLARRRARNIMAKAERLQAKLDA